MKEFKYEIAFSFLKEDEGLAIEINNSVQDRFKTFLYSKQQEELAGRDGEAAFNDVFAEQSRFVVILIREKWGSTPWTRIEETAIRNRAFAEGWEFTLFVVLQKGMKLPPWIPKIQLYYDFDRWGVNGLASVIERKAVESGANSRVEGIEEKSARLKRQEIAKQERISYLNYGSYIKDLEIEIQRLLELAKNGHEMIKDNSTGFYSGSSTQPKALYEISHLGGYRLRFQITNPYEQDRKRKYLRMFIYSVTGHQGFPDYKETIHFQRSYIFDIDLAKRPGWSDYLTETDFITTESLVDEWIHKYLDNNNGR